MYYNCTLYTFEFMKDVALFVFILLHIVPGYNQNTLYVSTTGSDSNDGTSIDQAWATIQKAMDEATPGSTVLIRGGIYSEKVEVNVSGMPNAPIVFKNYQNENPILDGNGLTNLDAMIGIFNQSHITIQGLEICNNVQIDATGIIVSGNCDGISILENDIHNIHFSANPGDIPSSNTNSQPLIVYGTNGSDPVSNLLIEGNTIHDSRTGFSEGLAVNGNVDGFAVVNNVVHHISNIGIDIIGHEGEAPQNDQARNGLIAGNLVYQCKSPYATAAGIYVDGGRDLIIERNKVYTCQWGIEVGCENVGKTTSNIIVRSNWIFRNDDAGIVMGGFDFPSGSGKVINCQFTNNSCYGNDQNAGDVTGEINISYTENCEIKNNIFFINNPSDLALYIDNVGSQNLTLNYNLYYNNSTSTFDVNGSVFNSFASYQSGSGQDPQSTFQNPLFEDLVNNDFHLTVNSPALDEGDPGYDSAMDELDIDGDPRVLNDRIDLGADESALTTDAHIITNPAAGICVYPNPFSDKIIVDGAFEGFNIQVINVNGQIIQDYTSASPPLEIDLSTLPTGVHFIKIGYSGEETIFFQNIIKQ